MKEFKLDKTAVKKGNMKTIGNDFEYWQTKSPKERLEAAEFLRQQYIKFKYGTDPGFRRFFKIIKRK